METLFKTLLFLHIAGGVIGLLTGTVELARRKGDNSHKIIGKVFVYGMLVAGLSSLALASIHPNYFLFIVGVFTVYLVLTGYRYMQRRALTTATFTDWFISGGMVIAGIAFIAMGIRLLISGNSFGIVLMVFGALGLRLVRTDFANFKGESKVKNYWLLAHLQRMTGAYIAAITAFLVVNAKYSPVEIPSLVFWLFPTAVLTPMIISWSRKYKVENKARTLEKVE